MDMDMSTGSMTDMTMTGMDSMTMTATSTGAMSSSTGMSGMDMGGMDMGGMDMVGSCKITMLWNWNTIDACFLSKSWQITSSGMFAGSCIGVICLVLCLEFLRRVSREYDAFIIRRARLRAQYLTPAKTGQSSQSSPSASLLASDRDEDAVGACCQPAPNQTQTQTQNQTAKADPIPTVSSTAPQQVATGVVGAGAAADGMELVRPTIVEHTIRSLLHMLQFAVAYFVMLLAMYFNGYFIICIFIGAFLGAFLFSWEPLLVRRENDPMAVTKCCG